MTRRELSYLKKLLERVQPQDAHVAKALALVNKDLAAYDARVGQLRDTYDLNDLDSGFLDDRFLG